MHCRVSIAMTTYNGAKYLGEQLSSILEQTRQPDELVVCDDASDDSTLNILQLFANEAPFSVRIISNTNNIGHIRNFEKVLSLCLGDFIFLSDQDDVWNRNKVQLVLSAFSKHPNIDVVINDAHYADEILKLYGLTVLEKVRSVGSNIDGHIAGACTAITQQFRNFILPFPNKNCPQHDVYLHRWANATRRKIVLHNQLQIWRIHGQNATLENEMSEPHLISALDQYRLTKDINTHDSYIKKAHEFQEMSLILLERRYEYSCLANGIELQITLNNLNNIVVANLNRAKLGKLNWPNRIILIMKMAVSGQYKQFKGVRSILKDILC